MLLHIHEKLESAQLYLTFIGAGDVDKLPEVLKLKLRRKDRNRLREKFERQVTLARVAEMRPAQAAPLQ